MGEGRFAALLAVVCGFVVGYKWPKIKRQLNPTYKRVVRRLTKHAKRGIHDAVHLFAGRTTTRHRPRPISA